MFDRVNVREIALQSVDAHRGVGRIAFRRLASGVDLDGACNFIDTAELPPGTSIGLHRHDRTEEEFYLVLDGQGTMTRDEETFPVRAGDLIRNRPGGRHGLVNDSSQPLRLFVFELEVFV